ncbi:MAG: hypothetical protein JXR37_33595 [Kiritimatiellae bacterium]|nr:hypothetical protein [Kiritimatiellia bacterium]
MASVRWAAPKDVRQDYDDTCWAAVMESFCWSNPGRPKVSQEEIRKQYNHVCHAGKDGTMTRRGLHILFADVRFGLKSMEATPGAFTSAFLYQKLQRGHVVLGYWESKISGWHVGLVYGLSGVSVSYLDPDYQHGGLLTASISHFAALGRGNVVVASRRW